jgi:hypothetical protein
MDFAALFAKCARPGTKLPAIDEIDPSMAMAYLRPFVDELRAVERAIQPFPTRGDASAWHEIEARAIDPQSTESYERLGKRFGVSRSGVDQMGVRRKWRQRRAILTEIQARRTAAVAMLGVHGRAPAVASPRRAGGVDQAEQAERRFLNLVDRALVLLEANMADGRLQAKELDILIRLAKYLQGHAERVVEHRERITPAYVERTAAKIARSLNLDAALAGLVPSVTDAEFRVVSKPDQKGGPSSDRAPGGNGSSASPSSETSPPSPSSPSDTAASSPRSSTSQ